MHQHLRRGTRGRRAAVSSGIIVLAAVLLCLPAERVGAQSLAYRIETDTLAVIDPLAQAVVDRFLSRPS